jgi:ribosomal protein S6
LGARFGRLGLMSKEKDMKVTENKEAYELAFHLVPSLGDDNVGKVFDEITKLVEKIGGKVVAKSEPALLNLEYEMDKTVDSVKSKYNTAYFAWIIFENGDAQKLQEGLESNTNLLRHLLVKTNTTSGVKAEEVAVMLEESEENSEQGTEKIKEQKKEKAPVEEKEEKEDPTSPKASKDESEDSEKKVEDQVDEAIDELVKL